MWAYSSCHPEMCHGNPWKTLPWGHGRRRGQWWTSWEGQGDTKGVHGVGEKALRSHIMVASDPNLCGQTVTRCANPRLEASQVQEAPSAVALLCHPCPGWMWAGLPQGNGLIICVCKPGGEFPIWQDGVKFCPGLRPQHHLLRMVLCLQHPEPEHGASLLCQNHSRPNPSG